MEASRAIHEGSCTKYCRNSEKKKRGKTYHTDLKEEKQMTQSSVFPLLNLCEIPKANAAFESLLELSMRNLVLRTARNSGETKNRKDAECSTFF